MTQIHQWLQPEYSFGTAEARESCTGCKQLFVVLSTIIVGRYRHTQDPTRVTPPMERWHETCFDIMLAPRGHRVGVGPGPNGAQPVRLSDDLRRVHFEVDPRGGRRGWR